MPLAHARGDERESAWESGLWQAVGRLVDRAPTLADLRSHGLELLALSHWRRLGRPVPEDLEAEARTSLLASLSAPLLLARVRAACDGPILLMKGPEVARCYPEPHLRPYGDLDLLVPDPESVQRALVAAGFVPVGDAWKYVGIHHLRPLQAPGFPLVVEVHGRPKWIDRLPQPPVEEFFGVATPGGADGVLVLPPAEHAVLLTVHAWAHRPLGPLIRLVDVAAVRRGVPDAEIDALARRWCVQRVWRATDRAIDAVLFGARRPWPLRVWARDLSEGRERTVLETHLERVLAGFSALPAHRALGAAADGLARTALPGPGERWRTKLLRTRRALSNAFRRQSEHVSEVERALARGESEDQRPKDAP